MCTGYCSLSCPGWLIRVDEVVQMKLELTQIFTPGLKCIIIHGWNTSDVFFFLYLYISKWSRNKSSKHWKPGGEGRRGKEDKQKMPDLPDFTDFIWTDIHKSMQSKVHPPLFGGIKLFWNEWICKFYLQTFKNLPVMLLVADEFWVRCFWKSRLTLQAKKWASSCSNLTSESNTLQKCLLSAVMHLFLETNIATKGCSHSQHSPAWGYARSTFPRYVCSSCSYICFRSNLASAGSNKNERTTQSLKVSMGILGTFLACYHRTACAVVLS